MNKLHAIFITLLFFGCTHNKPSDLHTLINHSELQFEYALKNIENKKSEDLFFPKSVENGNIKLVTCNDWTSGFFAGNLWMMFELSGNEKWKKKALEYTLKLEQEKWNASSHEIGFKMYNSYGKALKYSENSDYSEILLQSAKTLASRYNPVVGCISSWDDHSDKTKFPVLIENMMNLELLLWAANFTGNENFKDIAIKHAQKTAKHHFRSDFSSYQLIYYNSVTGEPETETNQQEGHDEIVLAKSQAWSLYGFTIMYRETGMEEFLIQAEKIAEFIIKHRNIKEGKIPYWDLSITDSSNEPYDASAAAIISSALFELEIYSGKKGVYVDIAKKLLETLSTPQFLADIGQNKGFLLKHSTGSKPSKSEIDVPLVYADYYFLESIIKHINYEKT